MGNDILTVQELCDWLKVKKSFVYRLSSEHRIPCLRIGSCLRFRRRDIETWLEQQVEAPSSMEASLF
jgi:excisionase family DNA binding protein